MKEIVNTRLIGGLGNFLFQIANAYCYAKKTNKTLSVSTNDIWQVHKNLSEYKNNFFKDIEFVNSHNINFTEYSEPNFSYDEIPNIDGNVKLHGYFQSENYLHNYEEDIKSMFLSNDCVISLKEKYKDLLENNITCSIHVRRGDYLQHQDIHFVQSINYYMRAVKLMPKESVFLIFSDDIEWCKNNFPDIPERFVYIENQKDFEDLYLMSLCDNNIIANSSFSWWGSWLNRNENKIVVAPKLWIGSPTKYNTKDLYCKDWIKL